MHERIEVVYENGVLRPVGALPSGLREHQHLTVSIEATQPGDDWLADANPGATLEAVRRVLGRAPRTLADMVREERDER
jgi:predicted DNA-binding antitoxin AbrB/MazE fold protein